MSRIVHVAERSLRATCFTALVVCQTVACGSSGTPDAGQGLLSDAAPEPIADGAPAAGDGSPSTDATASPNSTPVFDEGTIVDFYVTFSDDAWNNLLTLTGPNETRWVPCTFTALGDPVVNADCRRKADMTDWPFEKKPQFIVRFNLTNKEGRFRGLRRVNLESFDGAAAPIRDRIGMWVMREAAIDAPRVNHVRVFKNGEILGLYMNIEAEDKEFLEDHFPMADDGNLWESGYELKTNEAANDSSRLDALSNLIDAEPLTGDHTEFFNQLAMRMDVRQVLREMAAETALITNDNFSQGSTNFAYYEHPTRGFIVLPWDLDSIITVAPVDADLYDYKGGSNGSKLRELMNQNPTWRAQFTDDLVDIRDNVMTRVPALVDEICTQIQGAVDEDPNRTSSTETFQADCAAVRQAVIDRIAAMTAILGR